MSQPTPAWYLAACYRVQQLALAVVADGRVIEVRRHAVRERPARDAEIEALIAACATEYTVGALVVEPGRFRSARALPSRTVELNLATAKQILLDEDRPLSNHHDLYAHLLDHDPRLGRLVRRMPGTGRIAATERWRTVMLLSVALALAAERCHSRQTSIRSADVR